MATLVHTHANIIRQLLTDAGLGILPSVSGDWPVTHSNEADRPDNFLTVRGTTGQSDGRSMIDGELFEHRGWQIRVRSTNEDVGHTKANAIRQYLSGVLNQLVNIDGTQYVVQCFSRIGTILYIGKDTPNGKRTIHTLNGLITVRQR
jgi:hypothetical protein